MYLGDNESSPHVGDNVTVSYVSKPCPGHLGTPVEHIGVTLHFYYADPFSFQLCCLFCNCFLFIHLVFESLMLDSELQYSAFPILLVFSAAKCAYILVHPVLIKRMFAQQGSVFSFISDQNCEEWNGLMTIILTLCDCKYFEVVGETVGPRNPH